MRKWAIAALISGLLLLPLLPMALKAQENTLGYNNSCGQGLVAGCALKTAAGKAFAIRVTNWGAANVVFVVDTNAIPTSPSTVVQVMSFPMAVGTVTVPTQLTIPFYPDALLFTKGIVVLCSSTGISGGVPTYTASATCTFEAETQ